MADCGRHASEWNEGDFSSGITSLEALETFQEFWRKQSGEQSTAHRGLQSSRKTIAEALHGEAATKHRAYRIRDCSQVPVFGVDEEGELFVRLGLCKDRLCPLCSSQRSKEVGERVHRQVSAFDACRFLTLTLKHRQESLSSALSRLREGFRRLRQRRSWRTKVSACVFSLEVKWSEKTESWHPHLHILADGGFWEQRDLAREWKECTGDSPIVDIRAVPSRNHAAFYIAKYVCKAEGIDQWPPYRICEFAVTMHGKRMIESWGRKRMQAIDETIDDRVPERRRCVASIAGLRYKIERGGEEIHMAATIIAVENPHFRKWIADLVRENEPGLIAVDEATAAENYRWAINQICECFNPTKGHQTRRAIVHAEMERQARLFADTPPPRHAD